MKDIEDKIPNITNLITNAALNGVKNKIPEATTLVKIADYNEKIEDIKNKCFTKSGYNKFMNNILDAKITEKN